MAFIAGKTRNLRLVTSVMILPYRNPVVTAKMLATIDVLSNGRVIVGVGVGWLREEFETLGCFEFGRRGTLSDEYLKIFKTLWTQEPASFDGEFYRSNTNHFLPKPIQKPYPPIWIGGHSRPALRRVARFADGWHPVGANPAVPRKTQRTVSVAAVLLDWHRRDASHRRIEPPGAARADCDRQSRSVGTASVWA
jgi:probable F420-dependent oxidoreductase